MKKFAVLLPALMLSSAAMADIDLVTDHQVFTLKTDSFASETEAFDAGVSMVNDLYAKSPQELSQTHEIFGIEDRAESSSFQVNDTTMSVVAVMKEPGSVAYRAMIDVDYQYDHADPGERSDN